MLDLFSDELIAAIESGNSPEKSGDAAKARAVKQRARHEARRAKSEANLAEILPARIQAGDSWHVISHGDIDSLSYLTHVMAGTSHFDTVLISTWCMARPDLEQIAAWLDAGRIDNLEMYVGEIFPNQYGDEYQMLLGMAETYGCKVAVARNHSKVILAGNAAEDYYIAVESSANVNTNPRIEQTAIHASRSLFDFYREFFNGIKSIDKGKK